MKKTSTLLFVVILLLGTNIVVSAQQKKMVGVLADSSIPDGCGCAFSFNKNGRPIFADDFQTAWMNIDGKVVKLKRIKETSSKGRLKVGSRSVSRYESAGITVDVIKVATSVCPPRDVGCEVTDYSATITVRKGNRTQVVRTVGSCGC